MAVMRQIALAVTLAVVATALLTGCPESPESAVVDTAVPPVNGNAAAGPGPGGEATTITAKGSDTLLQVAQALAEAYMKQHPDLDITVTGGGTGTGFTALVQGTADIADASRKIKDEEAKACKAKGVEPMENLVGYDGIAVIVNKASPVTKLTMDQLSDLYTGQIRDWKALGGKGEVVLLSRDSTSGTYEYFKEHVVQKGDKKSKRDFAPSASRLPSTSQIVERVAKTEGAIGYVGLGYLDDSVKTVPIVDKSGKPITPSIGTVKSGAYPISRPLFMYTKQDAGDAIKGYMDWIVSPAGQDVIKQEGFVPLK